MTATDQAFIRAYQQPPTQAGSVPTPHLPTVQESASIQSAGQSIDEQHLWGTMTEYATAYWDQSTAAKAPVPENAYRRIDSHEPTHSLQVEENTSTSKPTLATALARQQQQAQHQRSPETTLDAFRLPRICQQLLKEHSQVFQPVISALAANLEEGRTVFGLASCAQGLGVTTNLLCIAKLLAQSGKSVALVDANFSNPKLSKMLGIAATTTWQEVLNDGAPIAEALVHSASDNIAVLPAMRTPSNELSEAAKLQASVTAGALRYEFDITLVDLGVIQPTNQLLPTVELIQAMRLDAGLLVVDPNNTTDEQQRLAKEIFAERCCQILGAIENVSFTSMHN